MKSALIYKHGQLTQVGCCRLLNPRHAAITAAIYTLNISIFVVLLYSWRIGVNIKRFTTLEDVYYGVQIAYLAIIGTHLFMILLSIVLLIGIYRTPINVTWLLVKRNRILSVPGIIRAEAFDLAIFGESRRVVQKEVARLRLINGMQILILVSSWLTYLPWTGDEYDWEVAVYFIRNNISKDQQKAWMIALYITSTPFFYNTVATLNVYLYSIGHLVLQHQFLNFFINQSREIVDQKSVDLQLKGCVKVHLQIIRLKNLLILPDGLILLGLFMVTSFGFGFSLFFLYLKPAYKTAFPILIYGFYLVVIAGYAQKLINVSEENYTNACAMPWENWNVDNRKSYLIFLMGIRKPNKLSAFYFMNISNEIVLKENISLIIPWVIGFITFMALEAVSMVYSNVLRDHVNKEFDALCKAEVAFFISRVFINMLAISGVMRFCNLLRVGISWKGPEVIEL